MTVSVQDTIFNHVGNGVTVTFAYNCQVLQAGDLHVYVNGVEITSGITKNGIGDLTGGTVTFSVAPANGATILLERELSLERTTDYQQNGDFLASVVNPDFNRIWMVLQQFNAGVLRALRFPKSDIAPDTELPAAADRADKLLSFDSEGNPIVVAASAQSATALSISLASFIGSSLIGFLQLLTGARLRTVQDRLRETPSLADFSTIIADGVTDQTATIVAWLATLPSTYDGILRAPYGMKFDADAVYDALPVRAILVDDSGTNSWDTAGSRARVICLGAERGDSTSVVDLTTILASSGHNASTGLDNRGTAGSASSNRLVAAFHWFHGKLTKGQPGQRQISRWEWKKIDGTNKWGFSLLKFVPWLARDWEYWYAATAYPAGAQILNSTGKTYTTVAGGTTGGVEPNHASGSAVDGTVTWVFLSASQDQTIFIVDEYGQMALNTSPLDGVMLNAKGSTDSNGAAIIIAAAAKASQRAELRLIPTDAGGAEITAIPRLRAENDGSLRLRTSGLLDLWSAADARGFEIGRHGYMEVTAANGDTTPSVANCGRLILFNTGATSVTFLDDSFNTQEVALWFANANTTLVHNGATFVLKGNVNVNPAQNSIIVMARSSLTAAWVEKSRNF